MIFTRSISNFWKIWNDTSPRPTGRGFLLPCTDTAQGFSFCPVAHKPHTSRLQRLSCCQCNYTATTSKAFTGLCSGLSADLPYSSAHGTAYTRAAYIPPVPRRTLCRQAQPPIIIRYIRVQGCALLWIHARQCSISQTMPARRGQLLPCADRWQVLHPAHLLRGQPGGVSMLPTSGGLQSGTGQQSGRTGSVWHPLPGGAVQRQRQGGRRGTIDGCRRISFRAFAR